METREDFLDETVDEGMELLERFGYDPSDRVLDDIFSRSMLNKARWISLMEKHPNYNGRLQIVLDVVYTREVDFQAIDSFARFCRYDIKASFDLLDVINVCEQYIQKEEVFDYNGNTNELYERNKIHVGEKRSRVVLKMAKKEGLDELNGWEREFAKYSDAINPKKQKLKTIISMHPIDFYTMSFGRSWSSCHTIDRENIRHAPNNHGGCYSSGTESYMLDDSSIVVYTVDADYNGDEYELQDKIHRCMFHVGDGIVVQGRVYPQDNDRSNGIRDQIRAVVLKTFAECMGVDNEWDTEYGTYPCCNAIISSGTHYRDYSYFSSCNVSRLIDYECDDTIYVGHYPICPSCGDEHDREESIQCKCCDGEHSCCECGCEDDDLIEIDGQWYCENHRFYCDYHEQYETGDDFYYVEHYGDVCSWAINYSGDFFFDNWVDKYYHIDQCAVETEDGNRYYTEYNAREDGYFELDGVWVCDDQTTSCDNCGCIVRMSDYDWETKRCKHCKDLD